MCYDLNAWAFACIYEIMKTMHAAGYRPHQRDLFWLIHLHTLQSTQAHTFMQTICFWWTVLLQIFPISLGKGIFCNIYQRYTFSRNKSCLNYYFLTSLIHSRSEIIGKILKDLEAVFHSVCFFSWSKFLLKNWACSFYKMIKLLWKRSVQLFFSGI